MGKRIVLTSAMAGAIVLALAAPAAAHVTVDPSSAPKGSTTKLSFLVPNEEPTAKVTEVQSRVPDSAEHADPVGCRRSEAGLEREGDDAEAGDSRSPPTTARSTRSSA